MKRLITSSDRYTPKGGYLYIFKHGIGPGTLPKDVNIIKTQDLPNYLTAVWLDRYLTGDELEQYDIPSETEIHRYLDRIGYCWEGNDIFPCDEVNACGEITASTKVTSWGESMYGGYYFNYIDDRGHVSGVRTETLQELKAKAAELGLDIKQAQRFDNTGDSLGIEFDDVEACDNIEADSNVTKYTLTPEGQKVFDVVQEIAGVWWVSISNHNNIMIVSDNYSADTIKELVDNVRSELKHINLMYAVSRIHYYRSDLSDKGFRLVVTLKKAYSNQDIEGCDNVMASEDDEDKIYWVQAYYSKPHKGLADDFATNDWDAAIDKLVDFANDGYYVMFENLASGEGYEYDPDEVLSAVESGDIYTLRRLQSLYEG